MELKILLRRYPGMQRLWSVALQATYSDARELAAAETGLAIDTSSLQCPYPDASILDEEFLPPTESPHVSGEIRLRDMGLRHAEHCHNAAPSQ
jgi:hypothetical protein